MWINTLNGKTWQKPDEITIEYWNGTDWAPVANQSKTTGFAGWSNHSDSYSGNVITFDAVTTSKLRFTFKVNAYAMEINDEDHGDRSLCNGSAL